MAAPDSGRFGSLVDELLAAPTPSPIDPYLVWFRLLIHSRAPAFVDSLRVSVLVEFSPAAAQGVEDPSFGIPGLWPSHLHATLKHGGSRLRYRPCVASLEGLEALLQESSRGPASRVLRFQLCHLLDVPDEQWRNAQPGSKGDAPATKAAGTPSAADERQSAREAAAAYAAAHAARARPTETPPRRTSVEGPPAPSTIESPLLCVVDDLCNFAAGQARGFQVASVWHQGSDARTTSRLDQSGQWGPALDIKTGFAWIPTSFSGALFGRRLTQSRTAGVGADPADEWSAYRAAWYPFPPMRASHGSHIMGLVSDVDGPLREAPRHVHFVQLPVPAVVDTTGGSLTAHAIAAIHHALEAAQPHQHVIVNISYGTHSGPHDGSSPWDGALVELLDRFDGSKAVDFKTLHIVLPAGNSHRSRSHAHRHVVADKPGQPLRWRVLPDDTSPSFLELWFPKGCRPQVQITSPTGARIAFSTPEGYRLPMQSETWALVHPDLAVQSPHGTVALLAVGATASYSAASEVQFQVLARSTPKSSLQRSRRHDSTPAQTSDIGKALGPGPHGVWTIEVRGDPAASPSERDFQFHAWAIRGDAAPGRRQARHGIAGRQTYFLDEDEPIVEPRGTLNGLGCVEHERLWVVGSRREVDGGLSVYSSAGPNRDGGGPPTPTHRIFGPDVVVAADHSMQRPGLLVRGMLSGSRLRVSGTSIASAAFARRLHDHLASGQPASTVDLDLDTRATRESPTGNPFVRDADPRLRGEQVKLR